MARKEISPTLERRGDLIGCVCLGLLGMACVTTANMIHWSSEPERINLTSTGATMDSGFRFELGVFVGGFTPAPSNTADWAAHWVPAQRSSYLAATSRFDAEFVVTHNNPPFVVGTAAWIWGFRGDCASGEWILFRKAGGAEPWTWPAAQGPGPPPFPLDWSVGDADTVVLGTINPSGSPFLMRSAAVTNSPPPATSWQQWRAEHLAGEPLNEPNDDPDRDGIVNIFEFIFGTPPLGGGPRVMPTAGFTEIGEDRFLTLTIPRRCDHPATLIVEVSSDLHHWHSGPTHTTVVADTPAALVVRDLTPAGPAQPRRFMRLRAEP